MQQLDLFGQPIDQFTAAKTRYGVWPITVWPVDHQDRLTRELKDAIGDDPNAVAATNPGGSNLSYMTGAVKSRGGGKAHYTSASGGPGTSHSNANAGQVPEKTHTSVFSPAVAAWLLNCYAPDTGLCLDPFAGGGTRAIMACKHGLDYVGLEIRPEEVEAVRWRCQNQGIGPAQARIAQADARDCGNYGPADFLLTCPPYYDLEMYEGGPDDLSMAKTYNRFLDGIQDVVNGSFKALKPGATACWVVGMHRDSTGSILPLHHDIASIHRRRGFAMKEEIILHQVNNGAIQRVGNFEKGQRHLIRVHEYALIFERLPNWRSS